MLYNSYIRHFSLILTKSKNSGINSIPNTNFNSLLNLEAWTDEDIKHYIKGKNYEVNKININNGEYYEDLKNTNFVSKKDYNSYYESIYNFLISKEKALDIIYKTINLNKVIYPAYGNNINLTNKQKPKKDNFSEINAKII